MPPQPVIVYLDSSDYSALSDPRRETAEVARIRERLLAFAKDSRVCFSFSGAHLSEMAPLDAKYTPAATARAALLVELCGRNALISLDRVLVAETERLANRTNAPFEPLTKDATWFPELGDIISPVQWGDAAREIDEIGKSHGANREARRALKRKLIKGNQPKAPMKAFLSAQDASASVSEIVARYPMRPHDAEALHKYVLGQGTRREAENAFCESLRDPRWMMQWFADHYEMISPVIEWMRGPSRKMAGQLRKAIEPARELRRLAGQLPSELRSNRFTAEAWHAGQDDQVVAIAKRVAAIHFPKAKLRINASDVDAYCPGLAMAIRTLHSAAWDSLSVHPREPQDSDFVDAIHTMYAPYVAIFRADRYMASHVNKYVRARRTRVVPRLQDLPAAIDEALTAD